MTRICPGSGQRTDRVHSSGAIVCPYCHGAYHASGLVLPEHEAEEFSPADDQ